MAEMVTCPKCDGDGCAFCGGTGEVVKATPKEKKALGRKSPKPKKPGKK